MSVPSNTSLLLLSFLTFFSFSVLQTVFAILGHSSAMLGDSITMYIDSLTYLFNLLSERAKTNSLTPKQKLKLQLISPSISIICLITVSIYILITAIITLSTPKSGEEVHTNTSYMLIFGLLNLFLDFLNMFCFARAKHLLGYDTKNVVGESTSSSSHCNDCGGGDEVDLDTLDKSGSNMNMCSAYTHVFADTLRSFAVILAGLISETTSVRGDDADAWAAVVVSVIIFVTVVPLVQGLRGTVQVYRGLGEEDCDTNRLMGEENGGMEMSDVGVVGVGDKDGGGGGRANGVDDIEGDNGV